MNCETTPPASTGSRGFTVEHLWALAVLACIWAFVATHPIRPHDFWWHLAIGRQIVQTHQIPQVDTFSYTAPGAPYPSYNVYWLADTLLYLVYATGGPALSVFVHSLLIALTYGLVLGLCWRLAGNGRVAAFCTLAAAACGFENWNLRPQAISFLLAALYLVLIYDLRSRGADRLGRQVAQAPVRNVRAHALPATVLAFPLLMVIWVNCHGSFPLGIILLGIWLLEALVEDRQRAGLPLVALALTGAATLLNPQGAGLFGYLRAMGANPVVQRLPEWAPATLGTQDGIAFFVVLGLSAIVLALAWRRLHVFDLLGFLFFAVLAWRTGRAIVWFGLVVAPLLAETLPALLPRPRAPQQADRAERLINAILALGLLALVVVTLPWFKDRLPMSPQKAGLISAETPVAATDYLLRHHLPPPVFADMAYGSYLIWAAQPAYKVFCDPRIELYPERIWGDYEMVSEAGPDWEDILNRYGVQTLMLDRALQPQLVAAASGSQQWRPAYQDGHTIMLVRRAR